MEKMENNKTNNSQTTITPRCDLGNPLVRK